jgi:hypothetical protein
VHPGVIKGYKRLRQKKTLKYFVFQAVSKKVRTLIPIKADSYPDSVLPVFLQKDFLQSFFRPRGPDLFYPGKKMIAVFHSIRFMIRQRRQKTCNF